MIFSAIFHDKNKLTIADAQVCAYACLRVCVRVCVSAVWKCIYVFHDKNKLTIADAKVPQVPGMRAKTAL